MRALPWILMPIVLTIAGCARPSEVELDETLQVNVAPRGVVTTSVENWSAGNAIDNSLETMWVSTREAPVWYSIEFDSYYLVDKIELVVSQHQPGPTSHQIWFRDESNSLSLYQQWARVETEDGHVLEVDVDPPRRVDEVFILTSQSQGWVAWREIRVLGSLDADTWILKEVVSGLEQPVQITHARDGSSRLYVVEKGGRIRTVEDGVVSDTPFLDIGDRIFAKGLEQGLLNIVFPPGQADWDHFYVSYTNVDENTVISRFRTTADRSRGDPHSEEILLTIEQVWDGHNGGTLVFGPHDGYLYIGSGDGGDTVNLTPLIEESTRNSSWLGKILRIDVESNDKPYGIPPDNPFVDDPAYRPEIWALGLRNPWGFAFDPQTGDLFIPDAGSSKDEEINFQNAASTGGENYGWPIWEGNVCLEAPELACYLERLIMPVTSFSHADGCAVVGGVVQQGTFYYGDFCRGNIWRLSRDGEGWKSDLLIDGSTVISSIGTDEMGNLLVTGFISGSIYALVSQTSELNK